MCREPGCRQSCLASKKHMRRKRVAHILHHPLGLLRLRDKLVLLLHIRPLSLALRANAPIAPHIASALPLTRVQAQPRILDRLPRIRRELQIRVQRRAPAGEEAALDLRVLVQAGLAHLLLRDGVFLERGGEGVLLGGAGVGLVEELRGVEGGARDGVVEGLGLRFGGGRGRERGLGFGRGGGGGEERDFFGDGAAHVCDGFAEVGRVVVGFVGVLGAAVHIS